MPNNFKLFYLPFLIMFLTLSHISYGQTRTIENPSLAETTQWIENKLVNYKFTHDTLTYKITGATIVDCKITISEEVETTIGTLAGSAVVSGKLSSIHPEFILISPESKHSPVNLRAFTKENSDPFERKWVTHYFDKEISYLRDDFLVFRFHSLALAERFKKALSHAAELCVQLEEGKPGQDNDLF